MALLRGKTRCDALIFVEEQPEPADFQEKVRRPGQASLRTCRFPLRSRDYKKYWRSAAGDLYRLYSGFCAYSASRIPLDVSHDSVDHFIPRHHNPALAYEWSNLRLCTEKMNQYKGDFMDVMDPFNIRNGWFIMNFTSFFIEAEKSLPQDLIDAIEATITRLKFNIDDGLIQGRADAVQAYADDDISFDFLSRMKPFIAFELDRQGLRLKIKRRLRKKPE